MRGMVPLAHVDVIGNGPACEINAKITCYFSYNGIKL